MELAEKIDYDFSEVAGDSVMSSGVITWYHLGLLYIIEGLTRVSDCG